MPAKIALIEDDKEVRIMFSDLFSDQEEIVCVGTYESAEEFISEFNFTLPDVVFMDIGLPGISGIECIRVLKHEQPGVHFIVYTIYAHGDLVFEAIKAGATGYLLKSTPPEKLVSAVHEILRGESPMSGTIAMKVLTAFQQHQHPGGGSGLNHDEQQMLHLLSKGYSNQDIALQLKVPSHHVKSAYRNIYGKLHGHMRSTLGKPAQDDASETIARYLNSNVKPEDEQRCSERINHVFSSQKPYLQEGYTLNHLAKSVDFPAYIVSQTINRKFNMGFFDLVNHHRIEEALLLMKTEKAKLTIEGIAYQCGFGSRTSFYNAFRKQTGCSPGEMMK
jgi:two-component system, NarL family, response regulator LiaR